MAPIWERAPGLAPGKSGFASRRLDDFGIARILKWGGRRVLPPLGDLHRIECWLLHHGLHLKGILRPVLPRHGPHYECGALLTSATEECGKWCSRRGGGRECGGRREGEQRICTSSLRLRRAACRTLTLRELKIGAPCRCRPGARGLEDRRACCYTNDANESGGCVRYRAGLSSSSARR